MGSTNSYNQWKGTDKELQNVVSYRLSQIREQFSLDEKAAKQVFCECMLRNLVVNEMDDMINFLINGLDD